MKKTERLGLRLTPAEKSAWKAAQKRDGYNSLSEWITAILNRKASE